MWRDLLAPEPLLLGLVQDACAGQGLAEVGVAQGDRRPDEAGAAAELAGTLFGRGRWRPTRRGFPRRLQALG